MFRIKRAAVFTVWSQLKLRIPKLRTGGFPIIAGLIVFLFIAIAFFGEFLAAHPTDFGNLSDKLIPPFFQPSGSLTYPLGTDMLGRDILSRLLVGARPSFIVGLTTILFAGLFGTAVGIISGYHRGRLDMVLMRIADSFMAVPIILAAMLLAVLLGPSIKNVVISIAIILWSRYARLIRGEVLSVRERDFVALARVAGASSTRIMFYHIFPNVAHTLLVMLTLQLGVVILLEASLSFLGAGIPPPAPVWGSMIARGRDYLTTAWWISFFPGAALALVVLSFNMLGDWLREVLDPKLRQV